MRELDEIRREIAGLPHIDTWGTKKEIKELPNILSDSEHVKALCSGVLDGDTWLIVCTEKRVLFLDRGLIYGLKQRETPIEKINSIEQSKGLVLGSISIWDGASRMEIKSISNDAVPPFVAAVQKQIEAVRKKNAPGAAIKSNADELIKLRSLLDDGILTQDEFEAEKRKILTK